MKPPFNTKDSADNRRTLENTRSQNYCFRAEIIWLLTLPAPRISESWIKIKIYLNFYFYISLWCLKSFY